MPDQYVLHIAKWYPNLDDDLEGIFIQRQIYSTHPYFNSVVFYARATSNSTEGKLFLLKETQFENNFTFFGYYKKKITGLSILDKAIKLILYFYLMYKFFRETINRFGKPSILHAHVLLRSAITAYLLSIKIKVPFVITEHATFFTNLDGTTGNSIKNKLRQFIVNRAKSVMTVSKDLELGMKKYSLNNENYVRIFNCVDTHLFAYQPKQNSEKINLLHVSEFKNEHKNIIGILNVIVKLKHNHFRFLFHLVGYGQDLDIILEYIKDHNLTDCVNFHGKLKEEQLSLLYSSADVFILYSNKENMPCVIAESLCCGTPVISTNVGGISEVINEENGILIERANADQLYDAIANLIHKNRKFDYQNISTKAVQLFSFESIGTRIFEVYRKSLKESDLG